MAFTSTIAGDRYLQPDQGNVKPKVPKVGYTPVKGDVVIIDSTLANGVDLIATAEAPYGIVENVNAWTTAAITRPISVAEFYPGCEIEFAYSAGAPALGAKVGFGSATRDTILGRTKVTTDASGAGSVIAVDAGSMHGTGYVTVRF